MLDSLSRWFGHIHFPRGVKAFLGFGYEYWNLDPQLYEGWEQLRDRLKALGRKRTKRELAYDLASHLLEDVVVAAGGVENSIYALRAAVVELTEYARANNLRAAAGVPHSLGHAAATTAWYAFADVLTWARCVVERMERPAGDRKRFPKQGLLPAMRPKRLRRRVERLLLDLRAGPVGQARPLANFMLHSALVQHPQMGVQLTESGAMVLPVPDTPSAPVAHWYLLRWELGRDGIALAEEIWLSVQTFVDQLLTAFDAAAPRRLRR